jgi:hypothetical protein
MTDSTRDEDRVASLLVPDDTSQAALIELFDTLESAGFRIALRDGYDSQDAIAYDLIKTNSLNDIVPSPGSPEDYDAAYREMQTNILSGPAFEAAIAVLAAHTAVATQHLINSEHADPDIGDLDERSLESVISETETQITDAVYERALENVEVDV